MSETKGDPPRVNVEGKGEAIVVVSKMPGM